MGLGHHRLDEGDFGVVVAQNQCAGEHFRFFLQFRAAHVQGVNPHGGHAGALGLEGGAGDHVPVRDRLEPHGGHEGFESLRQRLVHTVHFEERGDGDPVEMVEGPRQLAQGRPTDLPQPAGSAPIAASPTRTTCASSDPRAPLAAIAPTISPFIMIGIPPS